MDHRLAVCQARPNSAGRHKNTTVIRVTTDASNPANNRMDIALLRYKVYCYRPPVRWRSRLRKGSDLLRNGVRADPARRDKSVSPGWFALLRGTPLHKASAETKSHVCPPRAPGGPALAIVSEPGYRRAACAWSGRGSADGVV